MREFLRNYLLKVLIGLIVLQLLFFVWLEKRNHRPVAVIDEISVFEGHSVKLQPLRNDTDKDEDELSIKNADSPLKGEISLDNDVLNYSVKKGFVGVDSFTYIIFDGKKESKKAFIKVTINENLKPTTNDDYIQMYAGNKAPISVLGNDQDREGDSLFISEFTNPLHGSLEQKGDILFYTSKNNSTLTDSFEYVISDGFSLSEKATAIIDVKSKNNAIYPWLSMDVGHPSIQGSITKSGNDLIIKGSGNDIWNNEDNCHYAYQVFEGDCEMVTLAKTLENTNQWAKIGIMIRESLSGNSKNAYMCLSSENGTNFQVRTNTGSGSNSNNNKGDIAAPYWLKIVRKGNSFTGYRSPDGKEWIEVGNFEVNMPKIVYIGLAVTSHDDSKICTSIVDLSKTSLKKL